MDKVTEKIEAHACFVIENMIEEQGWEDTINPVTVNMTLYADEDDKYYSSTVVATILSGDYIVTTVDLKPISVNEYIHLRSVDVDPSLN